MALGREKRVAFAKLFLVSLSIFALFLFIWKKSDRATDFYQSENPVKHASELEEKVYELQHRLIFELRRNVEMLLKRNVLVETLPKLADKEVAKHNKLENIDGKWFLSKLGLNLIKNQTYLMNLWQHLSLTLEKKLIPSIKEKSLTLTTYLEPKIHYLTDKSIEVLYTAKQVLTLALIKGFDVSYYYLEIYGKWYLSKLGHNLNKTQTYLMTVWQHLSPTFEKVLTPDLIQRFDASYYYLDQVLTPDLIQGFDVSNYYLEVNRIMTIAKLHLKKKVQISFESCTKNVWHGFKKLVNLGGKKIRKVTQRAFSSG
uniref:Uncharacterized protein n=1 Tax=Brassica oleracea var. oleracea TaxID=109376 RepID=A0A0D3BCS2_BRAOL